MHKRLGLFPRMPRISAGCGRCSYSCQWIWCQLSPLPPHVHHTQCLLSAGHPGSGGTGLLERFLYHYCEFNTGADLALQLRSRPCLHRDQPASSASVWFVNPEYPSAKATLSGYISSSPYTQLRVGQWVGRVWLLATLQHPPPGLESGLVQLISWLHLHPPPSKALGTQWMCSWRPGWAEPSPGHAWKSQIAADTQPDILINLWGHFQCWEQF